MQIRYEIYDNGKWTGHWHYRQPAVDCSTNGSAVIKGTYHSRYPTRSVAGARLQRQLGRSGHLV